MDNVTNTGRTCQCKHHSFVPGLVVLFGLTFLLEAFGSLSAGTVSVIWPILVILAGILKMTGRSCGCCKKA